MSQFQPPQPPTYVNPQAYQWPSQSQPLPQQPPPQPPRKRNGVLYLALWCAVLLCVVFSYFFGYLVGANSAHPSQAQTQTTATTVDQPTQADTSVPTQPPVTTTPAHTPKWTTVQTFTGNGEKTTATFTTSGDWKLVWTAQADSASEAFFGLSVYGSDGSLVDSGADATIPAGKQGTDSTEEHTGAGSFYLKIYAGIPWTVQVQELK